METDTEQTTRSTFIIRDDRCMYSVDSVVLQVRFCRDEGGDFFLEEEIVDGTIKRLDF